MLTCLLIAEIISVKGSLLVAEMISVKGSVESYVPSVTICKTKKKSGMGS